MIAALFVSVFAVTSCGDDDEDEMDDMMTTPTATELLTNANGWTLSSISSTLDQAASDNENNSGIDAIVLTAAIAGLNTLDANYENIGNCQSDDVYTFTDTNNIGWDNADTPCLGASDLTNRDLGLQNNGTWALSADEQTLTTTVAGQIHTYTVNTLTATNLSITETQAVQQLENIGISGVEASYTLNFTAN